MSIEFLNEPQVQLEEDTVEDNERLLTYVVRVSTRTESGESQNEAVGTAKCRIFEHPPIKIFKVERVDVRQDARSLRLSSMLMRTIEKDILKEGAVGILKDMVGYFKGTPQGAIGMYQRHGWEKLDKERPVYLVFNLPHDSVSIGILGRVIDTRF